MFGKKEYIIWYKNSFLIKTHFNGKNSKDHEEKNL
jgi:hypothetical protein